MRVADAQGPPGASKPADPTKPKPPEPNRPVTPEPKPATEPAQAPGDVEYNYLPLDARHGVMPPIDVVASLLRSQPAPGWEFAGTFTSKLTEQEYARYVGRPEPVSPGKSNDHTVMVFKKQRTPAKQAPVTIMDGKGETKVAAEALLYAAMVSPVAPDSARCTTAFTVTETPEFGVTVTYTYKPGEVVAPQHLRYAGKNATAPSTTAKLPKQVLTRIPPQTQDRLEAQPVPTPSAAPQVKPLVQPTPTTLPATPIFNGQEYDSICTKSFAVGENNRGMMSFIYYEPGDLVRPSDAGLAEKLGGQVVSMMRQRLLNASGGHTPEAVPVPRAAPGTPMPARASFPPDAGPTSEPVVIELKVLSPQIVVMLCQEVLPKSVKVIALSETGKIIVINATPSNVAVLKKLLAGIDVPGKGQRPVQYDPLEPVFPTSREPNVIGGREPRGLQPLPPPLRYDPMPGEHGTGHPLVDLPLLSAPRIEPVQPAPLADPKPAKKPKTKTADPATLPPPTSRS